VLRANPGVKVLFVSGYALDPAHRQLEAPLLPKPFAPDQLVEAVKRLIESAVIA
jgi:hypothetical protein